MFEAVREVNNPDIDARGFGAGVLVSVWWRWWRWWWWGGSALGDRKDVMLLEGQAGNREQRLSFRLQLSHWSQPHKSF